MIDFGRTSALRSQTLWHAIAYGVSAGAPPTLSFVRPAEPYVCLGYHRSIEEVDLAYCTAQGLPVYRRMVGGGPVYLDSDQLFFQIALPAADVSPSRARALRDMLSPAVAAYRAAGVDASLDRNMEIAVEDRKICGHGAGQIEDAVVVCGNLIEGFDHERAARVLRLPDEGMRSEVLRLMRRYVSATPADPEVFRRAAVDAYATALGLQPVPGDLTGVEREALVELDERFTSDEWIAGPARRPRRRTREVKVRAGVWVFAAQHEQALVMASVVDDSVERARLSTLIPGGEMREAEDALAGVPLAKAPDVLGAYGDLGRQFAAAFAASDGKSL
ncbi:biotin/lipoate A/B protein ligase family protein [Streptomyces caeni]|uniref:Biotin/lipoate A/B protein ligase family protein n=1 Tax=Streptomyces caeni TaxID=2307231 RepID=A0ABW4IRD4_9ACTN